MNIAKIGLAVGLLVASSGLTTLAYADNLNGTLNGTANCNVSVSQAAQVTDPSCSLNSGHDFGAGSSGRSAS